MKFRLQTRSRRQVAARCGYLACLLLGCSGLHAQVTTHYVANHAEADVFTGGNDYGGGDGSTAILLQTVGLTEAKVAAVQEGIPNNAQASLVFSTSNNSNNSTEKMRVTSAGNVGIGTSAPSSKLEINGSLTLTANSGASMTFPDGTIQGTAWNGVLFGGDYAESVNVSGNREAYEPGDVLVIDPGSEGNFLRSSTQYSTAVTGIYSTKPGVVGRRQRTARTEMKQEVPMAMTGIVPTKVSAENGPIRPGDLLVTSLKPGYAMKGTDRSQMLGAVIGKAIGHLDSGAGVIEAVVTLQ